DKTNKLDLKKLNQEIENLKRENKTKQERIIALENQIKSLNDSFKSEVIKKAQEAQTKLDQKIKEYQNKYEQEIKHNKKYALKNPAIELIDIISNFDIAVNSKAPSPEIANYLKGFQMFANMFKNFLSQNGINEIIVNVNDDFNAEIMQAFETEKRNGVDPNKVLKVVKKGYKLHDIVIVPTTVIVSE
ncbi:MAG: nucleotide exchange factor GrpE, partial [Malacoplasma sp.]|nr:nucleotide exchange factor GrpE [Malacoplasma sp.]